MYRSGARLAAPLVLGAALLLAPVTGSAQEPLPGVEGSQATLIALFSDLSPSQDVRIVTPTLFIEEGRLRSVGEEVVEVSTAGETVPVHLNDIRALSVKSAHGLKGALWGLGAGILVGSVTGMLVSSFDCTTPLGCDSSEKRGALRGGVILGLAGATTGFLVGRADDYWKPIFP